MFKSNWTTWEDILVFNFSTCSYLLQGKKNVKTNSKKFKVTKCGSDKFNAAETSNVTEEKLIEKNLFNNL